MASSSRQTKGSVPYTPQYIDGMQRLCRLARPTVHEVSSIVNVEFRRVLEGEKPEAPPKPTVPPLPSHGGGLKASKKRGAGGKSQAQKSSKGDGGDGGGGVARTDEAVYTRSCTWQRDVQRCWLIRDLEAWNLILSKTCFELREYKWGELTLQGYTPTDNSEPPIRDVLRASLLVHLLLMKHRCVLRVVWDQTTNKIEPWLFWHAIKTCNRPFDYIEFHSDDAHFVGMATQADGTLWCHSLFHAKTLSALTLFRTYFDEEVAKTLGSYVQDSTSLTKIVFKHVQAESDDAFIFLEHLARNRSVKTLAVSYAMLSAGGGAALAHVLANHVALEALEINGSKALNPSAVLIAAARSPTLKTLSVSDCIIKACDISAMVRCLRSDWEAPGSSQVATVTPVSRLERLAFFRCVCIEAHVEVFYAGLIGGVLERLTVTACGLTDIFAAQAVFQLRKNRKLKQLFMQHNKVTVDGHRVLLKVLRKNKGLQELSINISEEPDVSELFDVLREGHFSRLIIGWIDPPGHVFAEGHDLCKLSSAIVYLDHRSLEDATLFLDTLVSYRQINALTIDCTDAAIPEVVRKMIDTLAKVKYLRQLHLNLKGLAPNLVLDVIRALEVNKSVHMLFFAQTTFDEKAIKALGRMVESNKTLNMLSIDLEKSDGDRVYQMRGICARLKEAILRNRFLVSLSVAVDTCNRASDYRIKDALRRNMMLVHDAIQFINGSSEKSDGIAFERLRFSFAVKMVLLDQFDVPENEAKVKIDRAKQRLVTDYFILTGIVKHAVVCKRPRRYRKYMLDCLKGDLMLRVCSYLSLTDILDV